MTAWKKSRWLAALSLAAALGYPASNLSAQDAAAPAEDHTAEFKVLDLDLERFDALLTRYPEPVHKITIVAYRNHLKSRVEATKKDFDQAKYDELRYDINLQCQRLANWMAPLTTPPRPEAGESTLEFALADLDPSPANPAEVKAALVMLDHEIKRLEIRARSATGGAGARAAEEARIKRVKERRTALEKNFTKAQWDAMVGDLSSP